MKHPLRVGQVFRCLKFESLVGEIAYEDNGKPYAKFTDLRFNHGYEAHCAWTERKGDWERKHDLVIDLRPQRSYAGVSFIVLKVALRGGGTGHGPHDVYPDGHWVYAKEVDGDTFVRFYQSGCFVGMVKPEDVELIGGPEDVECKWTQKYVQEFQPEEGQTVESCRHCGCEWICPECDGKGI